MYLTDEHFREKQIWYCDNTRIHQGIEDVVEEEGLPLQYTGKASFYALPVELFFARMR